MSKYRITAFCVGLIVSLFPLSVMAAQNKDHPLFGRYEGSEMFGHKHADFDEADLINGQIADAVGGSDRQGWMHVEGESDLYSYKLPPGRSTLEVLRNYETSLKGKGFEIPYTCATSNGSCYVKSPDTDVSTSSTRFGLAYNTPCLITFPGVDTFAYNARYLFAKLS